MSSNLSRIRRVERSTHLLVQRPASSDNRAHHDEGDNSAEDSEVENVVIVASLLLSFFFHLSGILKSSNASFNVAYLVGENRDEVIIIHNGYDSSV